MDINLSQKSRRARLGVCDVNNYIKRYKEECGTMTTRVADKDELEQILHKLGVKNKDKNKEKRSNRYEGSSDKIK